MPDDPIDEALRDEPLEVGNTVFRTPLSDVWNAETLETLYGNNLHYCASLGGWFLWSEQHWVTDTTDVIFEWARTALRQRGLEALDNENELIMKHVMKSFSHGRLVAMLAQAATFPALAVVPEVFDTDPWLLNCLNGTLNLKTGQLQPHRRDDYITKCLDVAYDPDALCPTWDIFLWRIMGGSGPGHEGDDARAQRLTSYLQRVIGYALTGETHEDCLFLLYGSGRNGKSRFLDTCHELLGTYAKSAQMSSFLHQDKETVRNDLADLHSVRMVSAVETTGGRRFSEGLLKQLTGGDRIKARFLFKEYFEFLPHFKIFLAFNEKPEISGTDIAIWERIKTIPFDVFIPPEERDKNLKKKLAKEHAGILAWAVRGCQAWQERGLDDPQEVLQATEMYRREMDTLQNFIEESCIQNVSVQVKFADFFEAYTKWCEGNGLRSPASGKVVNSMKTKGYHTIPKGQNKKWYEGIGLQ